MQLFNNMLAVGMKAMIINTTQEVNRDLIGSVVTIEMIPQDGENVKDAFESNVDVVYKGWAKQTVYVSGLRRQVNGKTSGGHPLKFGYAQMNSEYLMPLPPLSEEEKETEKENELETVE